VTSNALRSVPSPAPSADDDFDVLPYIDGIGAFLAGPANVIMQLAWPGVGYGVVESPVDSGKTTLHPFKRFRTTFSYLAVAMMGDEDDRRFYREAVNTSHRQVRSGPDSPVQYNAFDPELQLWVAACLYYGIADIIERLHGRLDEDTADALYVYGARMGTTLQVKPEMWPADRAAFEEYWQAGLRKVSIDPTVRRYLYGVMSMEYFPWILRVTQARAIRFFTTGFLPQPFRDEMHLSWSSDDQRRFDRRLRVIAAINRRLPGPIRRLPFNYFLWDVRRRVRTGRKLV